MVRREPQDAIARQALAAGEQGNIDSYRRESGSIARLKPRVRHSVLSDFDELLAQQGGGVPDLREAGKISQHVDHDHETGEVRGHPLRQLQRRTRPVPRLTTRVAAPHAAYVGDLPPLVDELEWGRIVRDRARELVEVSG